MTNPDELERAAGNLAGLARDLERYDPWGGTRSRSDAADLRLILAANRKMAEALAASPSVGGWEDISTAPKDGTPILMWGPYEDTSVVAWRGGEWACLADGRHAIESQCDFGTDYISLSVATHWMPLPPPPSVSTGSRPQEAVPTEREVRLVLAARAVAFGDGPTQDAIKELDAASEAYAADVPWEDKPEGGQ